MKTRLSLSEH